MKLNIEKSLISETIPDTHPYFTQDSYFVPELDFLLHSYYIILHNNSDSLPPQLLFIPPTIAVLFSCTPGFISFLFSLSAALPLRPSGPFWKSLPQSPPWVGVGLEVGRPPQRHRYVQASSPAGSRGPWAVLAGKDCGDRDPQKIRDGRESKS